MNSSTLTRLTPTEVALEFPIADAEMSAAEERAYRALVRSARLPGFRKGKIPRKIFEQAYGKETLTSRAVDEVLPDVYARALREHDLEPVKAPRLEVLEQSDGRPTRVKATVEVRPSISLAPYTGVSVTRRPIAVSDEDLDRSIAALARERATLVPVDREARLGDVVTVDFEGSVGGEPFEGGSGKGEIVELSEGRFIPGFAAGIAGMRAGETKQIEATFPDAYPVEDLAGKAATFGVTLHDVKEIELPPLDDEFAKAVSENQTIAALREDIRRRLEAVATGRSRRAIGNAVVEKLIAANDFPLPESLVESEIDHIIEDLRSGAGEPDRADRDAHRAEAEARVRASLLLREIAKTEKIVATPADVNAELEALARRYGQPVARVRAALGENLLSLMDGIVRNKTLDFLIDNAEVRDEETEGAAS